MVRGLQRQHQYLPSYCPNCITRQERGNPGHQRPPVADGAQTRCRRRDASNPTPAHPRSFPVDLSRDGQPERCIRQDLPLRQLDESLHSREEHRVSLSIEALFDIEADSRETSRAVDGTHTEVTPSASRTALFTRGMTVCRSSPIPPASSWTIWSASAHTESVWGASASVR